MPSKPPRPCAHPGCSEHVTGSASKCKVHSRGRGAYSQDTGKWYGSQWRVQRKQYLTYHPYCATCGNPAKIVDHIRPHRGDETLFWDRDNWQPLCVTCHNAKTARGL